MKRSWKDMAEDVFVVNMIRLTSEEEELPQTAPLPLVAIDKNTDNNQSSIVASSSRPIGGVKRHEEALEGGPRCKKKLIGIDGCQDDAVAAASPIEKLLLLAPKIRPSFLSRTLGYCPFALEQKREDNKENKRKCTNADIGCTEAVLPTDMEEHLRVCYFRKIACKAGCNNFAINFNKWMDHLMYRHATAFPWVQGSEARLLQIVSSRHFTVKWLFEIPTSATSDMVFDYPAGNVFNKDFVLRMQLTDIEFYAWMSVMGDKRDAQMYKTTIGLFGPQKKQTPASVKAAASWTLPVVPYHEPESTNVQKIKPVIGSTARKVPTYRFQIQVDLKQ